MSAVQQICEDLERRCRSFPKDVSEINEKTDQTMREALRNRSLWQQLWNWVDKVIAWAQEEIAKIREIHEQIRATIEKEILPFIFAPFYLDRAGDEFARVARDTATLAGRMAAGQIQPQAGWSGAGYNAYEITRGQQEAAAKVTGRGVQMLSSQLHRVCTNQIKYWETIILGFTLFVGDSLAKLTELLDVTNWPKAIPLIIEVANDFRHLIAQQIQQLTQYMIDQVPLLDEINAQIMSSNELAGGSGWPLPAAAMTQPSVPGEPPTWNDGDSGPNKVR